MTFREQLEWLGHRSYESYLASEYWALFKEQYQKSDRPQSCLVCSSPQIELHHHTYERLGKELFTDIDPLCTLHHHQVHELLKDHRKFVDETAWAVRMLREQRQPTLQRKNAEKAKGRKYKQPTARKFTEAEQWINEYFAKSSSGSKPSKASKKGKWYRKNSSSMS